MNHPSQLGRYSYTLMKEGKSPALTVLRCTYPVSIALKPRNRCRLWQRRFHTYC